jgi:hypothetical protein
MDGTKCDMELMDLHGCDLERAVPNKPELVAGLHVLQWWRFKPVKGEDETTSPWWVSMDVPDPLIIPDAVKDAWRRLVRLELGHGRHSSYKRYHEPIVFQAATDAAFRRGLLDEAFAEEPS